MSLFAPKPKELPPCPMTMEKETRKIMVVKTNKNITQEEKYELAAELKKNIAILPPYCEIYFGEVDEVRLEIKEK